MKPYMYKYIFLLLVICCVGILPAQNLSPNPSYELHSSCPTGYSQLNLCTSWTNVTGHTGTPDYFHTCGTAPVNTVSAFWGSQAPATGSGYTGVLAWHSALPSGREYIQTQLISPLVGGSVYTVSIKASLGDICNFATNLQAYFSNAPYVSPPMSTALTALTPQVNWTTVAINKTGWTTLTAAYTATGGEQYVIVGNFKNDAATILTPVAGGSNNQTYYFTDDFSVTLGAPLPVQLTSFEANCANDKVELSWSTSAEVNNDFFTVERSIDGIQYVKELVIAGAGNSNGILNYNASLATHAGEESYYRLIQTDFDGNETTYDPLFLSCDFSGSHSCPHFYPFNETVVVEVVSEYEEDLNFTVQDFKGSILFSKTIKTTKGLNTIVLPCEGIAAGIYILQMAGLHSNCVQKFFVN